MTEVDGREVLREEINLLREELLSQWEYNHYEHCGGKVPCQLPICHWPKPKILAGMSN